MKATGQMVSVPGYIPALRNAIETLERGQKLEIKAECHSDDLAYEIDFDALPWQTTITLSGFANVDGSGMSLRTKWRSSWRRRTIR